MVHLQDSGMLEGSRFKDVPDPRTRPNRIYPWELLDSDQRRDGQCLSSPCLHRLLYHSTLQLTSCCAPVPG